MRVRWTSRTPGRAAPGGPGIGPGLAVMAVAAASIVALAPIPVAAERIDGPPPADDLGAITVAPSDISSTASTDSTAYRPVGPCRLLDTRLTGRGPLDAGETIRIQVAGACGTPTAASVAVLSLTVTETSGPGFVTAFPAGTERPVTSNLNFRANGTVANLALVPLGGGAVDIYVHRGTELVVDVSGAFVPVDGGVRAGRFVPVAPTRLLDTRLTGQRGDRPLRIPLPPGVPSDATAVALNVTIVDAARRGFVTVHPAGSALPVASVQNADLVNRTRAVAVIVPVGADGVVVHRSMTTDIVVDFNGWFTGASAPLADDGLFVPNEPTRIRDSRLTFDPLHAGGTIDVEIADDEGAGDPSATAAARTYSAMVANLTAVNTVAPGFVTAHPARHPRPEASNVNARWRVPTANLALVAASTAGVSMYAHAGTQLLVDLVGRFTGDPLETTTAPEPGNPMPVEGDRILFVSDSAFASIRWLGKLDWLRGATFQTDLESCRRLTGISCRGREGYAPSIAVDAIRSAPGRYTTLVITAGYNDPGDKFRHGVEQVLAAARAKGIPRIVWLTYRQDVSYVSPYGASYSGTFVENNRVLRSIVASGLAPEIEIAEWHNTTTSAPRSWFEQDRLHLSSEGARGAATYVSRKLAFLERRSCPPGLGGATTAGGWCADPDRVVQFDLPTLASLRIGVG